MTRTVGRLEHRAGVCESAAARRVETRGERFAMTVDGQHHRSRVEAGTHLRALVISLVERSEASTGAGTTTLAVGELGGLRIEADLTRYATGPADVALRVEDLPLERLVLERVELPRSDLTGLVARLEHRVARLDETVATCRAEALVARDEVGAMAARIGRPFEHQGRLESLRARLVEVNEALAGEVTVDAPAASVPVATTDPGPAPDAVALGRGPRPVPAPVLPTLHQRHELHTAMYGPTETPPVIQA